LLRVLPPNFSSCSSLQRPPSTSILMTITIT
jgi:hypothetical protein